MVTTIAGNCGGLKQSVDGTGNAAHFQEVDSLSITADGIIYVSDNNAVRAVTLAGEVTTLPISVPGHGGKATVADNFGNLLISSRRDDSNGNGKIYIYSNGELTVFSEDKNHSPVRLAMGPDGSPYVLDNQRTADGVGFVHVDRIVRIQ
eukprot:CAMPEP_0175881750 /NCGR_PEP_ID=MMETSP0107_2-20121207/43037_1 /TAXON_ID=195067 ORGANISM="Goniomonas pacifica, Strain CCMP1869" /NCGR_SAMPLE_ID=MMETSP0107_2 /ASSEMBLY_ACC=CAM_ASM_000203 /LENGTH=148 /DNA_ID=CAMNT_0017201621 /DNA_START=201 /DNA_END=647 /DNA_ORIENTATION=-